MGDTDEYMIDSALAEGMESVLADVIRKYPILYDKAHKYRFQSLFPEKHDQAWNKISDELNLEMDSCKSLWSCIKQKFIKHRKRLDKGEPVTAWSTYDNLVKWLDCHVKRRRTRQDFIKQMRMTQKLNRNESGEDGEPTPPDDEWLNEAREDASSVSLKRKSIETDGLVSKTDGDENAMHTPTAGSSGGDSGKCLKMEIINDLNSESFQSDLFTDIGKDNEIVVIEKCATENQSTQIELIEIKNATNKKDEPTWTNMPNGQLTGHIQNVDQIITRCVQLAERCITENTLTDPTELFGKYISSLVRELPPDRRCYKLEIKGIRKLSTVSRSTHWIYRFP